MRGVHTVEPFVMETPHGRKCRGWGWCYVGDWLGRPGAARPARPAWGCVMSDGASR